MKKIAMPMIDCDLCDRFEEFQYFLMYDFEDPLCIKENMEFPTKNEVEKLPGWLYSKGVTDIIARGIDQKSIKCLNHTKIHVFVGVKKKSPEDLIRDYMDKILETDEKMCY
jgi:predicted Fe-Mo cluster-binding NifX family protein